jgi:hypothetical protein
MRNSIRHVKRKLTTTPILAYPDFSLPFKLYTDASNMGLGAVLSQTQNRKERVIAYASRTLQPSEKNYETTKKECLAVVWGCKHFHPYISGMKVHIYSDHKALAYIAKLKMTDSLIARWAMTLDQYYPNYTIEYKEGKAMGNADGLSRLPLKADPQEEEQEFFINSINFAENLHEYFLNQVDFPDIQQQPEVDDWFANGNAKFFARKPSKEGLKRTGKEVRTKDNQIVLGDEDAARMATWLHQHPGGAAHYGVDKTMSAFKLRFYNPSVAKIIAHTCRSCIKCQEGKDHALQGKAPMKPIIVSYPWQMISIDIAGPYPETPKSNFHLLTIVDAFSGFAVTAAMKNQTSETVCDVIMEKIVAPFGCPLAILSDQGRQFEGRVFAQLCDMMEIEKKRTVSYHPQTNGKNERIHRTLNNMFRSLPKNGTWERYLPLLTLTYNSAPGASAGMPPYKILFGRNPYLPCDLVLPEPPQKPMPQNKYIRILHDAIETTRKAAEQNLIIKQDVMKKQYDKKIRRNEFGIGEKVMLLYIPKLGEHRKMAKRWAGPYEVLRQLNDVNFEIQMESRKKIVHHNQLKHYFSPSELEVDKMSRTPQIHQYIYQNNTDDADETEHPRTNIPDIPHYAVLPRLENENPREIARRQEIEEPNIPQNQDLPPIDQEMQPIPEEDARRPEIGLPEIEEQPMGDQLEPNYVALRKSSRQKALRTTYDAATGLTVENEPVYEQSLEVYPRWSEDICEILKKLLKNSENNNKNKVRQLIKRKKHLRKKKKLRKLIKKEKNRQKLIKTGENRIKRDCNSVPDSDFSIKKKKKPSESVNLNLLSINTMECNLKKLRAVVNIHRRAVVEVYGPNGRPMKQGALGNATLAQMANRGEIAYMTIDTTQTTSTRRARQNVMGAVKGYRNGLPAETNTRIQAIHCPESNTPDPTRIDVFTIEIGRAHV